MHGLSCISLFTFAPTLLLRQILRYLEEPEDTPREIAWLYCIGLLVGSLLSSVGNGQALFLGRRICIRLRAIIIGEVYAKALRRRDVSASGTGEETKGQANNGQIINLMAIDAFKVAEISAYLHYLVASVPMQLVNCNWTALWYSWMERTCWYWLVCSFYYH